MSNNVSHGLRIRSAEDGEELLSLYTCFDEDDHERLLAMVDPNGEFGVDMPMDDVRQLRDFLNSILNLDD